MARLAARRRVRRARAPGRLTMGARDPAAGRLVRRERVRVRGVVQGVGFRPFVFRLARELELDGVVLNDGQGVLIDAQGSIEELDALVDRLMAEAPPLARIEKIERTPYEGPALAPGFRIESSKAGEAHTVVPADAGPCNACRREIFTEGDRRHGYAFTNCTHCGPRYSISTGVPYDRSRTSMASFAMCDDCRREYEDPADRRFHAQPNACPKCGPKLAYFDAQGHEPTLHDPLAEALLILDEGEILAVKGVGGFQLACDARNFAAVTRLRDRKHRDAKPFAVMVSRFEDVAPFVEATPAEQALLRSPERPIVLLKKTAECDLRLQGVAPGMAHLGVMLPSSPLHELLCVSPAIFVMTSANPGGEPLVTGTKEAFERLQGIADAFLVHDREIVARCDDSVAHVTPRGPAVLRRARGYVPRGIRLPRAGVPVLATGAWLKSTACATRGQDAHLSPHIGDLDNAATCTAFEEAVDRLLDMLQVAPVRIAHDLHPDMHSSAFAAAWSRRHDIPSIGVQHHHAHVAAVCAEHGIDRPVLGVALDGVGIGTDGQAWGGELLRVDGARFTRLGHLSSLALPGGDRAAEEPWRVAAGLLDGLGRGEEIAQRFIAQPAAAAMRRWLDNAPRIPRTTSAGRWFDAAAALLGIREINQYEGQAAMELEAYAERHGREGPIDAGYVLEADGTLDLFPLAERLLDETDPGRGAAYFHDTLGEGLARWVLQAASHEKLKTVALAGGCFANRRLTRLLVPALERAGIEVLQARLAPCNDGGLALGQAWIATLWEP